MSQASVPGGQRSQPAGDAPPPYSMSNGDALVASSATSSVLSLPSTLSDSPAPLPAVDSKVAPVYPSVHQAADVELPEDAGPARGAEVTLPRDVQRAKAPLKISQKNSSITGNFLILQPNPINTTIPDLSLHTTNARISSAVYVDPKDWDRPVSIEADDKNASVSLAVYTMLPDQALDLRVTTKNASANLLLPRDFRGLLRLATTNGKKVLSPELRKASVLVNNPDDKASDADNSILKAVTKTLAGDSDESWYEINGGDGPSRAVVVSDNARVCAGFVDEEQVLSRGGGSCAIM